MKILTFSVKILTKEIIYLSGGFMAGIFEAVSNEVIAPDISSFNLHTHTQHELYCFIHGSADYYVEGSVYNLRPGDILLMRKGEAHSLLMKKNIPYKSLVINFDTENLASEAADHIIDFIEKRPLGKNNKYSAQDLKNKNIHYYLNKTIETKNEIEKKLYLTLVLNELSKETPISEENDFKQRIFLNIVAYINANLSEEISLESLSKRFYLSKTHLIRLFKKYTGTTFWNYLLAKRLVLAHELLQKGNRPTTVFIKAGFNDYSTFFKAYKSKYGKSPKEDFIK